MNAKQIDQINRSVIFEMYNVGPIQCQINVIH